MSTRSGWSPMAPPSPNRCARPGRRLHLACASGDVAAWLKPEPGHALEGPSYVVDPMGRWMMRFPADPDVKKLRKGPGAPAEGLPRPGTRRAVLRRWAMKPASMDLAPLGYLLLLVLALGALVLTVANGAIGRPRLPNG